MVLAPAGHIPHHRPLVDGYPALIRKCYDDDTLGELDALRQAVAAAGDGPRTCPRSAILSCVPWIYPDAG